MMTYFIGAAVMLARYQHKKSERILLGGPSQTEMASPLVSPDTESRNARILVCGYFDSVERCRRDAG